MGLKEKLADEFGIPTHSLLEMTSLYLNGVCPEVSTAHSLGTAVSASTAFVKYMGTIHSKGKLIYAQARSEAIGVNSAVISIFKCSAGATLGTATTMVTSLTGTGCVANANNVFTITSGAASDVNPGDSIYVKVVSVAGETLCPLQVQLKFRL